MQPGLGDRPARRDGTCDSLAERALGRERDERAGRVVAVLLLQRILEGAELVALHVSSFAGGADPWTLAVAAETPTLREHVTGTPVRSLPARSAAAACDRLVEDLPPELDQR